VNTATGPHDIQYNDIQHNDTQHNWLICDTQPRHSAQHYCVPLLLSFGIFIVMLSVVMLGNVMVNVVMLSVVAPLQVPAQKY
jgi:hypothetical protein